jgi:outer membrane protein TolC
MRPLAGYVLVVGMMLDPGSIAPRAQEAGEAAAPLTLQEALRAGLEENAALAATRAETEASAADLKVARAARWPRLFTEAGVHRTDNQVLAFGDELTAAEFTSADFAIDSLNHPGPVGHGSAAVAVEVPIDASGRVRNGIEAAAQAALASGATLRSAEADLVVLITESYHGVSLAAAAVEVAEASVQNAAGHERVARARFENGAVLKSDFLRAQVHRLARERDLERTRADLETARARLRFLLGLREGGLPPLAPAGMEEPGTEVGDLLDWIAAVPTALPEIEAARRTSLAAAARGRAERASRGPELSGTVRYERNGSGLHGGEGSFFAGVGIRWTAFDPGRRARLEAARARAEAAAATSRAAEDQARLEVERAYRDTGVAIRNLSTARRAVAAAEEARRISADRYASGLLPMTDLLDAETALLQARLAEISARYDAIVGRVRLERAAGLLEVPR